MTTEKSASILVFPKVIANGTRDTVIQITNTSNSMVHAHCFYVNGALTFPEFPPGPQNPPLWIETDFDPAALGISVELDGTVVASSTTERLAWDIIEQLVYLTSIMELGPGDVVLTGAPGTTVPVRPGQSCRIRIDGLGELENHAIRGPLRAPLPSPDRVTQED